MTYLGANISELDLLMVLISIIAIITALIAAFMMPKGFVYAIGGLQLGLGMYYLSGFMAGTISATQELLTLLKLIFFLIIGIALLVENAILSRKRYEKNMREAMGESILEERHAHEGMLSGPVANRAIQQAGQPQMATPPMAAPQAPAEPQTVNMVCPKCSQEFRILASQKVPGAIVTCPHCGVKGKL